MDKEQFSALIKRIQEGTATVEENALVEQWIKSREDNDFYSGLTRSEVDGLKLDVHATLMTQIRGSGAQPRRRTFFLYYKIAAALLILIVAGGIVYIGQQPKQSDHPEQTDLQPGTTKAFLTLADGSIINLEDAKPGTIATASGTAIQKTKSGEIVYVNSAFGKPDVSNGTAINTIVVPRAGQFRVVLPDGTHVWLNAFSTLKYPVTFGQERKVELTGEAYFEVAKLEGVSFIVKTAQQHVEVLGTHFNVRAYDDETTQTTLTEGVVRVIAATGNESAFLKPGQQSLTQSSAGAVQVQDVDVELVLAWKNGLFQFKNTPIEEVMRQFSRWYDVDVVYEGEVPKQKISGKMYRNVNASQALQLMGYLKIQYRFDFKDGNKQLIITQ